MIHILRPWKLSNFQDPPPRLSIYFQSSFTSLTLDVQFQTNPSSLPNFKRKPHYLLFGGFMLWCVQLSKNITKCLLFIITQIFSTHFAINLYFCTTWRRKQTMEKQPHHACERTKLKHKRNQVTLHSNWPRVLLFDLAHKQCSGIVKGWVLCLTSVSKWRFLVNNILVFGSAWCLVMAQIQFFLIKKIKTGRPKHLLTPHPPTSDNISFLPYPPHTPQSGRHMCITPNSIAIVWNAEFPLISPWELFYILML